MNCQGLHKANVFGQGKSAAQQCIQQLSYIQIDTISVIERAHHHTFWTRIPTYQQNDLDVLQRERKIFEYWSHAASYLPINDFRFCLPYMNAIASGEKHWRKPDKKTMNYVVKCIQEEGAKRARDFEHSESRNANAWGGTKPAKIALEQLFIEGKLMISHREGFQKVYDLTERVLPGNLNTQTPTNEEYLRYLIDRTIDAQGLATDSEIGYLRKGIKSPLKKLIRQRVADGEIVEVSVDGSSAVYYSRQDLIEQANSARVAKKLHLLSPFDNLVIQRKRIHQLFDFDYQIECYVTAAKRKHGYFCLPILFGDELVGRLDPKADRKNRNLMIQNLVIEKEIIALDSFIAELHRKLISFAKFNDCDAVSIVRCNDNRMLKALNAKLKNPKL